MSDLRHRPSKEEMLQDSEFIKYLIELLTLKVDDAALLRIYDAYLLDIDPKAIIILGELNDEGKH